MSYRDENEALRARIEKLEEENRELHEKLDPKPKPPEPPQPPKSDPPMRGRSVIGAIARKAAWVLGLGLVLGGCLYVCSHDFRMRMWDGKTPFVCANSASYGEEYVIKDKVVRVPGETAFVAQRGCTIKLLHCEVHAKRGVTVNDGSFVMEDSRIEATEVGLDLASSHHVLVQRSTVIAARAVDIGRSTFGVVLEQSRIEGSEVALQVGSRGSAELRGTTTLRGSILPLDARVVGMTSFPAASVTKTPHAVAPLELIEKAREMTLLGASARLRQIDMVHVDVNGLVDLDAADYKGTVVYTFEQPLPVTATPLPVLRPGLPSPPTPAPKRRIVKSIRIDKDNMQLDVGKSDETAPAESVVPPGCTLAQLWSAFQRTRVPENAVAHIVFDASGTGAWHFDIAGTPFKLDVANDPCGAALR
jgi:hypothetical protein